MLVCHAMSFLFVRISGSMRGKFLSWFSKLQEQKTVSGQVDPFNYLMWFVEICFVFYFFCEVSAFAGRGPGT